MTDATFGFDSAFLQRVERLSILNRQAMRGPAAGPRGSPRQGASVEFSDFRNYVTGDDFRRVDWKAYARLDRLFLRLYRAEELAVVTLFLDHSSSMSFGVPTKALTAGRLAAILSYIALNNYDTVAVAGWGGQIDHFLPGQSGGGAIPGVWRTIAKLVDTPAPATDFASLRSYGRYRRGAGIAIVFSDFMTDSDWRAGLRSLRAAGQEVTAIQILSSDEVSPPQRGDWKLVDAESGTQAEVTLSPHLLRRYREALERHTAAVTEFCRREGISFVRLSSDVDLAGTVITDLQAVGVLG
ncbi:MAG: DUF58 domain-containing protein [Chloroflexota bacterium]|nr:MAG: DUF58 domain-containing protein [Chloroflexota bacterium]